MKIIRNMSRPLVGSVGPWGDGVRGSASEAKSLKVARALALCTLLAVGGNLGTVGAWGTSFQESNKVAPSARKADTVLQELRAGNLRFSQNHPRHPHEGQQRLRDTTSYGQHPKAVVLGCADSRVSPELLFDHGVGDLFDVRVAGNVANEDEVASVEYAVEHLHTPVVVVLGHTHCGAVSAVASGADLPGPNLEHLVGHIRDAVQSVRRAKPSLHGEPLIAAAVEANVRESLADVLKASEVLRHAVEQHRVVLVGAVYDIQTGEVRWLEKAPSQSDSHASHPTKTEPIHGYKEPTHEHSPNRT